MGEVPSKRTRTETWLEDGEINMRVRAKDNERKGPEIDTGKTRDQKSVLCCKKIKVI